MKALPCLDQRGVAYTSLPRPTKKVLDMSTYMQICLCSRFATSALGRAKFGVGSGEIYLDDLKCQGNETGLSFCKSNGYLVLFIQSFHYTYVIFSRCLTMESPGTELLTIMQ